MPAVATPAVPLGSVKVKMDDRKRPVPNDLASSSPQPKRQAVTVNGTSTKPDDDFPGKEDIDRYQKDAILRQMREYKREKISLEQQLAQATERAEHHDEHLRIIDAWFLQLLDEMTLLWNFDPPPSDNNELIFSSSLLSANIDKFNEHLSQRSEQIKSAISKLFSHGPPSSPDVRALQDRLASLLAVEKTQAEELQRVKAERDLLDDRLFNATTRYMTAEKQLDRAKSAQVAKLEAQARASSKPEASGDQKESTPVESNGHGNDANVAAVELARKQAVAVSEKQREQLERLAEENKKLTADLTIASTKFSSLTDDDYANTELFKHLKAQHTETIKRINDLEARNVQLREEAKQLQAERTAYREEADNEIRNTTIEIQSQLSQTEADLARIRSARDELVADLGIRKATADQQSVSLEQLKELSEARETRITALESEIQRLKLRGDNEQSPEGSSGGADTAAIESKLRAAENEKGSLEQELRSMESAWRKASGIAAKKVAEILDAEERISRMSADKAKADQKYFAAMKLKEAREYEIKTMRAQNVKSSEIVSQLKDAESNCRALLVGLEKQLAEANSSLQLVTGQHRAAQQTVSEHKASSDQLAAQATDLKKTLALKDETLQVAQAAQRAAEIKSEELQASLEASTSEAETWKKKVLSNSNEDFLNMRKLCWCTVCNANIKNRVITTCHHALCKECVDKQIQLRSRRCPICSKAFGANDLSPVQL